MKATWRFLLFSALLATAGSAWAAEYLVFIGTYAPQGKGIYAYRFSTAAGEVTPLGLVAETPSPSFLAVHPSERFLYAVNEVPRQDGTVTSFSIDRATGKLTELNKVSARGGGPCFVSVDKSGKTALIANYGGGSVAAFPIQKDGRLGEAAAFFQHEGSSADPKRQQRPHAHSINPSPDNRFAVAADLGLDQLLVYRMDPAKAVLTPHDPPFAKVSPGAGPRHFAFHPGGRFAYVINELQSTVAAFAWNARRGVLSELETISTLPEGFSGQSYTAEVQVHPNGRFLFGSNRGHDSIAVFSIDARKGTLSPVEHVSTQGKTPRNFSIDPTGSFLFAANQGTGNVTIFRIDAATGRLTPGVTFEAPTPVCVKFVRAE